MGKWLNRGLVLFMMAELACASNVRRAPGMTIKQGGRVAFVDFPVAHVSDPSRRYSDVSGEFIDAFNSCLIGGPLTILDRQHIRKVLQEQLRGETGLYAPEEWSRLGQLLQADYLLVGNGKVEETWGDLFLHVASVRMIDVVTGQVVLAGFRETAGMRPSGVGYNLGCEVLKAVTL